MNGLTIDISKALEMGELYFPQIKKMKEEKEKEEIKKWARSLSLKGQHLKKINQYEKAIVRVKKRIDPRLKLYTSIYFYMKNYFENIKKETKEMFTTGFNFIGAYNICNTINNTPVSVEQEGGLQIGEDVVLSFEEDVTIVNPDFITDKSEQESEGATNNQKNEYKEIFKKDVIERIKKEKISKMEKENPFIEENIFDEFNKKELLKSKEKNTAKEKLEKLFA